MKTAQSSAPGAMRPPVRHRIWFGLAAAVTAFLALSLTAMAAWFVWLVRCDAGGSWSVQVTGLAWSAVPAAAATLVWLAVASLLRVSAGGRGLHRRAWWTTTPLAVAALTVAFVVVVPAPSPTAPSCQLDLH